MVGANYNGTDEFLDVQQQLLYHASGGNMKYVTVELQTMEGGAVANLTTVWDTRAEAEGAFHTILAAAAKSGLPAHACTLLDSEGHMLDWQCYRKEDE